MLSSLVAYVGWCWAKFFFVKNLDWKLKAVQTFVQHFIPYFSCKGILDVFRCYPNMLDQHSFKERRQFCWNLSILIFECQFHFGLNFLFVCLFVCFWMFRISKFSAVRWSPQVKALIKSATKGRRKEMLTQKKEVDRWRRIGFDLTFRRACLFIGDLLQWLDQKRSKRESYTELIEHLETTSAIVKSKQMHWELNLGRETCKRIKHQEWSGYQWVIYQQVKILWPVLIFMICSGFSGKIEMALIWKEMIWNVLFLFQRMNHP